MDVERLEHLEQRPRRLRRRIAHDDHVEEVLPDAPKHSRKRRSQQLKRFLS